MQTVTVRRLVWVAVGLALLLVVFGVVRPVYVVAPLTGLAIWRVGTAMLGSLRADAPVANTEPKPVDPETERVVYWCEGCGAELLLLMRGAQTPPRHCGEGMTERREVPSVRPE
jgi:hypothetical protein